MCEDDKPCDLPADEQAAAVEFATTLHTMMQALMVRLNEWQPNPGEIALAAAVFNKLAALGRTGIREGNELLIEYARLTQLIPYAEPDKAGDGQRVRFQLIPMRQMANELRVEGKDDSQLKVSELALAILGEPKVRLDP